MLKKIGHTFFLAYMYEYYIYAKKKTLGVTNFAHRKFPYKLIDHDHITPKIIHSSQKVNYFQTCSIPIAKA